MAVDDSITATQETPYQSTISLLANDSDVDGDSLTAVSGTFTTTAGGTIVIATDGSYTYTPPPQYSGPDSVNYTVTDGFLTDVGTLTIDVQAINKAPMVALSQSSMQFSVDPATQNYVYHDPVRGDITIISTGDPYRWTGTYNYVNDTSGNGTDVFPFPDPSVDFLGVKPGNDRLETFVIDLTGYSSITDLGLVLDDIGVNTQLTIKAIDALGNAIDISNAFKTLGQYVTDEKPNFTGFNEIDRTSSTQVVVTNNGTGNAQGRTVFLGDLPTNTASIEITMQSTSNEQLNLALYDMAGSYQTDYIAGGPGIAISSSITSVSDEDDTNIESARIVLTNAKAGDVLNIDNSLLPTGVTAVTDTSTPGQIIINVTGSATKSDYAAIIKGITFENTDTSPDTTPRVVQVTVNDGDVDSNVAVSTIDVATGGSLVSSGSAHAASADAVPLMTSMNFAQSFSLKQVAALHDQDNDSLNGDSSNAEAPLPALTQLLSTDNTASLGVLDVASTFTAEPVTSVATDTSNVLIPDNLDLYAPLPVVASLDDDQLHSSGHI